MLKLSDAQHAVLSTACQREDGWVFPITLKLKGNAIGNVLKSLLTKGLLDEIPGQADDTVWRYDDGAPITLKAAPTAYDALGIAPKTDPATEDHVAAADDDKLIGDTPLEQSIVSPETEARTPKADAAPRTRANSKQATLIEMLQQPEGATIEEIVAAFGWQPHTVRGVIAGALKKKLGLKVESEKVDPARGRVYRIAS